MPAINKIVQIIILACTCSKVPVASYPLMDILFYVAFILFKLKKIIVATLYMP